MKVRNFGRLDNGMAVEGYTLQAGAARCEILSYGGTVRSLEVPDRTGHPVDIVLGFDRLEDYVAHRAYMGALVGRCANRIAGGRVCRDGVDCRLSCNEGGQNHLHGGHVGFDRRVWLVEEADENLLILSLFSEDGEEGYPGNLSARVSYTLSPDRLRIDYWARSDRDTLCSLTSHCYFNLHGHHSGPVGEQQVQLQADCYTPIDGALLPLGELAPVEGTPMDLRSPVPLGSRWDADWEQLRRAGGFDHNWAIRGETGLLRPAARAYGPRTGITLELSTTLPGLQLYTGNALTGLPTGKGGVRYGRRWGFCLESQFYPDSPNHPAFPSAVLPRAVTWRHSSEYRFG